MLQLITPEQAKISPYIVPGICRLGKSATQDIIINAVCNSYDIHFDKLKKRSRKREIREPRQVIMYLLCLYTSLPLKAIGNIFGGYDHTTVIHARKLIYDYLCTDVELSRRIMKIKINADISDKPQAKRTFLTRIKEDNSYE